MIVAPITASPGRLLTGRLSPVSIDSSTDDAPSITDAVHRNLLAGPHDQHVAGQHLRRPACPARRRRARRGAVFAPRPISARIALPPRPLAIASSTLPRIDEGDDDRRGVVEGVLPGERRHDAVEEGDRAADGDERVHVRPRGAARCLQRARGGNPSRRSARRASSAPAASNRGSASPSEHGDEEDRERQADAERQFRVAHAQLALPLLAPRSSSASSLFRAASTSGVRVIARVLDGGEQVINRRLRRRASRWPARWRD